MNHRQLYKRVLAVLVKDTAFSCADIWKAERMIKNVTDENPNHDPENGQFTEGSGGSSGGGESEENEKQPEDISGLLGKEHKGVKGHKAIDLLLNEKNGHVKGAFHRKEIGDIDLLWGDDTFGLQHIIKRRNEEGFDGEAFLTELPNVIRNGEFRVQGNRRFRITYGSIYAVISPTLRDHKLTFLLSAFEEY